jgi:hypothetical protein
MGDTPCANNASDAAGESTRHRRWNFDRRTFRGIIDLPDAVRQLVARENSN